MDIQDFEKEVRNSLWGLSRSNSLILPDTCCFHPPSRADNEYGHLHQIYAMLRDNHGFSEKKNPEGCSYLLDVAIRGAEAYLGAFSEFLLNDNAALVPNVYRELEKSAKDMEAIEKRWKSSKRPEYIDPGLWQKLRYFFGYQKEYYSKIVRLSNSMERNGKIIAPGEVFWGEAERIYRYLMCNSGESAIDEYNKADEVLVSVAVARTLKEKKKTAILSIDGDISKLLESLFSGDFLDDESKILLSADESSVGAYFIRTNGKLQLSTDTALLARDDPSIKEYREKREASRRLRILRGKNQ